MFDHFDLFRFQERDMNSTEIRLTSMIYHRSPPKKTCSTKQGTPPPPSPSASPKRRHPPLANALHVGGAFRSSGWRSSKADPSPPRVCGTPWRRRTSRCCSWAFAGDAECRPGFGERRKPGRFFGERFEGEGSWLDFFGHVVRVR